MRRPYPSASSDSLDAKYRYVQLVRSLKTYGITFFDCVQKSTKNKKGQQLFIGVTRDKITKVQTPPLASPLPTLLLTNCQKLSS